jgi:hypothetical protein
MNVAVAVTSDAADSKKADANFTPGTQPGT